MLSSRHLLPGSSYQREPEQAEKMDPGHKARDDRWSPLLGQRQAERARLERVEVDIVARRLTVNELVYALHGLAEMVQVYWRWSLRQLVLRSLALVQLA